MEHLNICLWAEIPGSRKQESHSVTVESNLFLVQDDTNSCISTWQLRNPAGVHAKLFIWHHRADIMEMIFRNLRYRRKRYWHLYNEPQKLLCKRKVYNVLHNNASFFSDRVRRTMYKITRCDSTGWAIRVSVIIVRLLINLRTQYAL